jgi:hypothetical protein
LSVQIGCPVSGAGGNGNIAAATGSGRFISRDALTSINGICLREKREKK